MHRGSTTATVRCVRAYLPLSVIAKYTAKAAAAAGCIATDIPLASTVYSGRTTSLRELAGVYGAGDLSARNQSVPACRRHAVL